MHKPDGIVTLADFMKIVNSVDGPKKFRLQKVDRCSFKHILNPVDRDCKYELIIAVCKLNDGTECHAIFFFLPEQFGGGTMQRTITRLQ